MLELALCLIPLAAAAPPGAAAARTMPPPVASSEYAARRRAVVEELRSKDGSALFLLRAREAARFAGDVDYLYRPDNDLYYLTGIGEDGCALLLSGSGFGALGDALLFLRAEDPATRVWTGGRLSVEEASAVSGVPVESVLAYDELAGRLRRGLGLSTARSGRPPRRGKIGVKRLYFETGGGFAPGEAPTEPYRFLLDELGGVAFDLDLQRPAALTLPLRQRKSEAEIALLEKAIAVTCLAQRAAMRHLRPGVHEYELRAVIEATFLRYGCEGWAFPPIIGSGPNSCILHYMKYGRRVEDGDLVLMDIGAQYSNYAADITRTVPANGRFTARQREIYEVVLAAQKEAIALVRPGIPHHRVDETARRALARGLVRLGMIDNEDEAGRYTLHRTSHGLGLAVHDPMPSRTLVPGMVITVEPGIYIPGEEIGVRIEDDVVVTDDGAEVLSAALPKEIDELEAWMRGTRF